MAKNMVEARGVRKTYGKTVALDGVDLTLREGEILGLLGPNGAGKTTLIKIIATLLTKDEGSVRILGHDLDTEEKLIRHLLGYVGQDTERSAYARLTARENLTFFGRLRGLPRDLIDEQIGRFGEFFDFNGSFEKQFMHLSGGQKQAVVIMRALLHDPPVIYLDEPTKGLDVLIAKRIRRFLVDYARHTGKTILLTSHIMSEVEEMSNRVELINKGQIVAGGTPDELRRSLGATEFIALERVNLPGPTLQRIQSLPSVVATLERDEQWVSFGLTDLFDGTQSIMEVLKEDRVKTGFRQHSASLEDAFIHYVGGLEEAFEA